MTYRYDLHVHTDASPCSGAAPRAVAEAAVEAGLDGIAVTDHDTVANVNAVKRAAPPELDVYTGVEVSTTAGHLLAIGVDTPPPQTDLETVVDHVHTVGGFAIPAHPFDSLRENCGDRLHSILDQIDAVEVANSRCVRERFNREATAFAVRHGLAETGGSDAHFPFEVGRAYTATERPLEAALERGETTAMGQGRYLSGHAATKLTEYLPL